MNKKDWDIISKDYYTEIISPIKNSPKNNPLLEDIKKIKAKTKNGIDLGCGTGALLPLISDKFKEITAVDFSEAMIEEAKKLKLKNVNFFVKDMKNLSEFHGKFDYAFSINSILAENVNNLKKIIKEIYLVLKKGGKLFAILPAMESYLYQGMLIMDSELAKGKTQKEAEQKAREIITRKEHNFLKGTITYEGDTQKALYRFEIIHRFTEAGFKNLEIKKIRYQWKEWKEAGQAYFPKHEPPWDWYLVCEK